MAIRNIMVSAGEISGDEHLADLARSLLALDTGVKLFGMAGSNARAAGVETIVDSEKVAGKMGFTEVLGSLHSLYKTQKLLLAALQERKPELLILIDFPDFNLRLAKAAKKLGVQILYYIIPKVWVWRSARIKDLTKYVDRAVVIFPFEKQFLSQRGFKHAHYLGNPIYDQTKKQELSQPEITNLLEELKLNAQNPKLVIFPGSRSFEIERHLTPALQAYSILRNKIPALQCIVALSSRVATAQVEAQINQHSAIIIKDRSLYSLQLADIGIIKSGTSNLQAACFNLPFAMIYQASPLSAWIVHNFVRKRDFSLVNIIKTGSIKELLQKEVTADSIAQEAERLLLDQTYTNQIKQNLSLVRAELTTSDSAEFLNGSEKSCAERVAKMILSWEIPEHPRSTFR